MRRLILGAAPRDFDPHTDIALGPFCFIGQEDAFPGFEKFPYPDDPFVDPREMAEASDRVAEWAASLLPELADHLNGINGTAYSIRFWRVMLMPWLLSFAQVLWERQERILRVVEEYNRESVSVELAPPVSEWFFADIADVTRRGVLDGRFNHWLFSFILREVLPANWEAKEADPAVFSEQAASYTPTDWGVGPLSLGNAWGKFKKMFYRFARCRGAIYGMGLWSRWLFSVTLSLKRAKPSGAAPPPSPVSDLSWAFDARAVVFGCIPRCFWRLEDIPAQKPVVRPGKLRLVGNVLFAVEPEKLYLARCVEGGERLVCVQHGGMNGRAFENRYMAEIEYGYHRFLTWGWESAGRHPVNAVPLPAPLFSAYDATERQPNDQVVMVGEYAPLFSQRFRSMPTPLQNLVYRENKCRFLQGLSGEVFDRLVYRPYPVEHGALRDVSHYRTKFPGLHVFEGGIAEFHRLFLGCRLFVHDYPGTSFNIAMHAGVPSIGYWDPEAWKVCPEAEDVMRGLADAGVLFADPSEAAAKVNQVYGDARSWWEGSTVQRARKEFCRRYARGHKKWHSMWLKALWKM